MPFKEVRHYQTPYDETDLHAHLARRSKSVAVCWLLTLANSTKIGATSCTHDLELPGHVGVTFRSNGGAIPSAVDAEAGQGSAGLEVEAIFDDELITEDKVAAGEFDDAVFEIFRVNYKALDMGEIVDFSGNIGEIRAIGPRFTAEARPKTSLSRLNIGRHTRSRCDARFCDAAKENRCKLDRADTAPDGGDFVEGGTVTTGGAVDEFTASGLATFDDDYFEEVLFTSGVLSGKTFEVRAYNGTTKTFSLQVSASELIAVGVTFAALRRCRRTIEDCIAFDNAINFRGHHKITNIEEFNRIIKAGS